MRKFTRAKSGALRQPNLACDSPTRHKPTHVLQTQVYAAWFDGLRDRRARARIDTRVRRLALGNPGDVRPVGQGVSEIRIDYGPGYRLYFEQTGREIVLLLCGGDKASQRRDIATALSLAAEE